MLTFYDISVPITSTMLVWPGDPQVAIRQLSKLNAGDEANVSQIRMSVHTGTHIDAPRHFLADGKTVTEILLDKLVGEALVVEMGEDVMTITKESLETHSQIKQMFMASKILFKTRNAKFWPASDGVFREDYTGINPSGARFLAEMGLDLVGLDYLSVATFNKTAEPHQIMLQKEIVLLEGVDLSSVTSGVYQLYCLPLPITDCEGAPARAILVKAE